MKPSHPQHPFLSACARRIALCCGLLLAGWASQVTAQTIEGSADPRTRARIHTELASLYFQDNNMAVAMEELQIAIAADPNYAPAYSVRGLVNNYLRETAAAESDFSKALALTPTDPEVNNNYGWFLCQQRGREKQAISHFMTALKNPLYATPDRAYLNAGTCALRANDLEAAEDYLQKGLRVARDARPQLRFQLANVWYQRSNYAGARMQLAEALKPIEQAGGTPGPEFLWLGLRIERKLGNNAASGDFAASLRKNYPESSEYQDFLRGNFE